MICMQVVHVWLRYAPPPHRIACAYLYITLAVIGGSWWAKHPHRHYKTCLLLHSNNNELIYVQKRVIAKLQYNNCAKNCL